MNQCTVVLNPGILVVEGLQVCVLIKGLLEAIKR